MQPFYMLHITLRLVEDERAHFDALAQRDARLAVVPRVEKRRVRRDGAILAVGKVLPALEEEDCVRAARQSAYVATEQRADKVIRTLVRLHLAQVVPLVPLAVRDLERLALGLRALALARVHEARLDEIAVVVERACIGDGQRDIEDRAAEGTPDVDQLGATCRSVM